MEPLMIKLGTTVLAVSMLANPAHAAKLKNVIGDVSVSGGEGFTRASEGQEVGPGYRILTQAKSSAVISYGGSCEQQVPASRSVVVQVKSPCDTGGYLPPAAPEAEVGTGLAVAAGAAAVVGGVVLMDQGGDPKPASP